MFNVDSEAQKGQTEHYLGLDTLGSLTRIPGRS